MLVTISLLPSAAALVKNVSPEVNALVDNGLALDGLGNYTGAIVYYDKVLAIDPKNVLALGNKGNDLYGLGNYKQAIQHYDRVFLYTVVGGWTLPKYTLTCGRYR